MRWSKLRKHIHELAKKDGITVVTIKSDDSQRGHAKVRAKTVYIEPLSRDKMRYWVALHELGHIHVGLHPDRLEREALAWKWAVENALYFPPFDIRQRMCANLVRYLYRAEHHGWKVPDKEHVFWEIIRWWDT